MKLPTLVHVEKICVYHVHHFLWLYLRSNIEFPLTIDYRNITQGADVLNGKHVTHSC